MTSIRSYNDLAKLTPIEFEAVLAELRASIMKEADGEPGGEERDHRKYRLAYIAAIKQKYLQLPLSRSVFISYTSTGEQLFFRARDFFADRGYKVNSWRTPDRKGDKITENIIDLIARSRFFLAIWSLEYVVNQTHGQGLAGNPKTEGEQRGWIPSMWMPFELASAITLDKCRSLLWLGDTRAGPHSDVFTRMLGDFPKDEINDANAPQILTQVYEKFEAELRGFRPG